MRTLMTALALAIALGGGAAAQERPGNTIQVAGVGTVETAPEIATISYDVRGEGRTSDDAVRALMAKKQAIEASMSAIDKVTVKLETGDMKVTEVRGRDCVREDEDDDKPRLSTGPCAVIGYIAEMEMSVDATPVNTAGTLAGLAARAGASNVRLDGFRIANQADARRRAMARAVANGKEQAEAIAIASGARLGTLLSVVDNDSRNGEGDIVVTGSLQRVRTNGEPRPIKVDITPAPVTTRAQLTLVFEIVR